MCAVLIHTSIWSLLQTALLSMAGNQNLSALANKAAVACVLSPRNRRSSAITCWLETSLIAA